MVKRNRAFRRYRTYFRPWSGPYPRQEYGWQTHRRQIWMILRRRGLPPEIIRRIIAVRMRQYHENLAHGTGPMGDIDWYDSD